MRCTRRTDRADDQIEVALGAEQAFARRQREARTARGTPGQAELVQSGCERSQGDERPERLGRADVGDVARKRFGSHRADDFCGGNDVGLSVAARATAEADGDEVGTIGFGAADNDGPARGRPAGQGELGSNRDLLDRLRDGRLDAIVIALQADHAPLPDLVEIPMFDDDICFAAPLNSPYAGRATVDLRDLRDEKFVTLGEDFATHRDYRRAFELAGFQPPVAMRVADIFSLTNLVSGGVGFALLPRRVAEFSPQVQFIPLDARYAISQRITLLLPKNRERSLNLLALSAECRMFRRG